MAERLSISARAYIESLTVKISKPAGLAGLSLEERKFLFAAMIAAVVPVDSQVKLVEIEKLSTILTSKYRVAGNTMQHAMTCAKTTQITIREIQNFAKKITELLGIEDRCALIGQMWDVALCDRELHASEEALIFEVADAAGVPRKRVIEQQARAAAQS